MKKNYRFGHIYQMVSMFLVSILFVTSTVLAQTGSMKWQYKTGGDVSSAPVLGTDGTVYFGGDDQHLYALNADGSLKWRYKTKGTVTSSPCIALDGTIYVGSSDNYLYAVNPDGSLKWKYETGDDVVSSPAVDAEGIVYAGSNDTYVYAVKPNGVLKWKYKTRGRVDASPAIDVSGVVYVGSQDNSFYAINTDGSLRWEYTVHSPFRSSASISATGTIYVGCFDGSLYALNPNGTLKWKYEGGSAFYSSPAMDNDGVIYIGCRDGNVYAINADGSLKWQAEIGTEINTSPAIGTDGVLFIASDRYLYALFTKDGIMKWRYKTGYFVLSSPAVGSNATVYVGSRDSYLHAVNTETPGFAIWPCFHGNAQHTGRFASGVYFVNLLPQFFVAGEDVFEVSCLNAYDQDVSITGLYFGNTYFTVSGSYPAFLPAGQITQMQIPVQVRADACGYYTGQLHANYTYNSTSGTALTNFNAGIFADDQTETWVTGQYAVAQYRLCKTDNPGSIATRNNLAVLYRLVGEYDRSQTILDGIESEALNAHYGYQSIWLNQGVVSSDQTEPFTAQTYYQNVLADNPQRLTAKAHYNRAWEFYNQNDYANCGTQIGLGLNAVAENNKWLKAKLHVLRGALYMQLGNIPNAQTEFQTAMILDPGGPIGNMAEDNLATSNVSENQSVLPMAFNLHPVHPNPFNPEASIRFDVPQSGDVSLVIYNSIGQQVCQLYQGYLEAGSHEQVWTGIDNAGRKVNSGMYVVKMKTDAYTHTQKMMLIK